MLCCFFLNWKVFAFVFRPTLIEPCKGSECSDIYLSPLAAIPDGDKSGPFDGINDFDVRARYQPAW
jgi:hypothetical protein